MDPQAAVREWGETAWGYYQATQRLKEACARHQRGEWGRAAVMVAADQMAERRLAWERAGMAVLVMTGEPHAWGSFYLPTAWGYDCLEVMQVGTRAMVRLRPAVQDLDRQVR